MNKFTAFFRASSSTDILAKQISLCCVVLTLLGLFVVILSRRYFRLALISPRGVSHIKVTGVIYQNLVLRAWQGWTYTGTTALTVVILELTLTLSLPESKRETKNVIVTFESVDRTLVCDHSNKSY